MVFIKLFAIAALASSAVAAAAANDLPRIDAGVHRALRKQATVNLIVTMKDTTANTLNSIQEADYSSRGARIASMVSALMDHQESTQTEVTQLLAQEAATATPLYSSSTNFWISNQVYIEGATIELVEKLSALSSIYEVREEQVLPVPTPVYVESDDKSSNSSEFSTMATTNEWGITKVAAPTVWAKGNTGKNVVVSTIDTGVLYTHETLKSNYRGAYGWYDPEKKAAAPYDQQGHGTHTMGTIAGSGGIGVAHGAKWMSCKGCRTSGCVESDLLACAQFITCPTDTNGKNADCSKAPDLVSNSWGGGQGSNFYQAAVDAWIKAGIVPIFVNGNNGPACATANSPGDYKNVIAVGATTSTDALASFSSKGPSKSGLVKPEISAPGQNVRSAWFTNDTAYNKLSGTSMAAPHVSGVIALMLSAKPKLTFDQIKAAIAKTADRSTLAASNYVCGNTADKVYPNNQYGYGRINAAKAVSAI